MYLHNSHDHLYREPAGPAKAGENVIFRFRADAAEEVVLRTWMGEERGFPMERAGHGFWHVQVEMPKTPGLYWYDFIIYQAGGQILRYGAPEDGLGGEGHLYNHDLHSFQLTIYDPAFTTPAWMHGANIYQIFPDRFCKAETASVDPRTDRPMHESWDEDFFPNDPKVNGSRECWGGNLNGIREKLPYLKDLGTDVLYLNPVFEAFSNHRYDTGDYTKVDALLGTEEELKALFEEARAMGIHVMLDGVFSHTGDDSIYFNAFGHYSSLGAAQSRRSRYYKWYTFEHWPDKYRCWWGVKCMPELRKDEPTYRKFMFDPKNGIVPRWLRAGASAWRLDVADELTMGFLRELRRSAKAEKPDAVVLGEVWEDASNKIAYDELRCYCTGDTLDSVMNYPLREAVLAFVSGEMKADAFVRAVHHQAEVYPVPFLYSLMNMLGSHDRARALNVLCGKECKDMPKAEAAKVRLTHSEYDLAVKRYKAALDLLCALPGCPMIYYGDEAGLTGTPDPYCRRPFPWGKEDKALQSYVRAKLNHRRASPVLQTGLCEIEAVGSHSVRIRRYMQDGVDAFGEAAAVSGEEVFTVSAVLE